MSAALCAAYRTNSKHHLCVRSECTKVIGVPRRMLAFGADALSDSPNAECSGALQDAARVEYQDVSSR